MIEMSEPIQSLRMLVIAGHEGRGAVHLDKLLPSLRAMGVPTRYVGWDRRGELPDSFTHGGIEFQMIFRGWGYANRSLAFGLPLWMIRAWLYLLGQRPNLVMALDFDAGLPTALASLFTRIPFIYNIRDNFAMRASVPRLLRGAISRLDRWVIGRAYRVIVPDESRIAVSDERLRQKHVVIYNCALEVEPPPTTDRRSFTVYAMGYLRESRGIGLLLDAAERLPYMRVLLAGDVVGDRFTEQFHERVEHMPNVEFRGRLPVEKALELCFQSDVLFTFYEPDSEINRRAISNKWSDAMMAGIPILVNREVLKSTWIEQEDIGYVCPYGDVTALVQVLEHIRVNPDEARGKGERGRDIYEAGYSWAAMERRIQALLDQVAQELSLR